MATSAVINDFRNGIFYANNKSSLLKLAGKGHQQEVAAFLNSIQEGNDSPIEFRSICLTTLCTFKIMDSLATGLPQQVLLNA